MRGDLHRRTTLEGPTLSLSPPTSKVFDRVRPVPEDHFGAPRRRGLIL
jgi:hypothetical protein